MNGSELNKEWHVKHRLPARATMDQRMQWHLEHVQQCGCRPIPAKIARELDRRGIRLPVLSGARMRQRPQRGSAGRSPHTDTMNEALIAPCGMHCATCSGYLAYRHHVPRKKGKIAHCAGCRARSKQCAYLKGECFLLRSDRVKYCFECPAYPCDRLKHTDERYRRSFGTSPIANLKDIRERGEKAFLTNQRDRFGCGECGTLKSVHSGKCFACDEIKSWKD